jgi:hypothetical protein
MVTRWAGKQGTVRRALQVVLPGVTCLGEGVVPVGAGGHLFLLRVVRARVVRGGALVNPGAGRGKT